MLGLGFGANVGGGFDVNAVTFDGIGDYLSRGGGFTGAVDSKLWTVSFWIKPASSGTIIYGKDESYHVVRSGEALVIEARKPPPSDLQILQVTIAHALIIGEWHHIAFSFDMADSGKRHIAINGVMATPSYSIYTDRVIDFTTADHDVGANDAGGSYLSLIQADIAEVYNAFGQYLDISVPGNLAKFRTTSGKPENLGSSGAIPTGSAPTVYLSGDTDSWHTNKGTGGGFTENGALATATTSPSD